MVVRIETTENVSNLKATKANVAQNAKTETSEAFLKAVSIFDILPEFSPGFTANSENSITPRVAKALSHNDVSYTDVGLTATITETAIIRVVIGSDFAARRYRAPEIISINPDLKTDGENPVNPM